MAYYSYYDLCIIARILLSPTSSINILSNILARVEYNAYLVVQESTNIKNIIVSYTVLLD